MLAIRLHEGMNFGKRFGKSVQIPKAEHKTGLAMKNFNADYNFNGFKFIPKKKQDFLKGVYFHVIFENFKFGNEISSFSKNILYYFYIGISYRTKIDDKSDIKV